MCGGVPLAILASLGPASVCCAHRCEWAQVALAVARPGETDRPEGGSLLGQNSALISKIFLSGITEIALAL